MAEIPIPIKDLPPTIPAEIHDAHALQSPSHEIPVLEAKRVISTAPARDKSSAGEVAPKWQTLREGIVMGELAMIALFGSRKNVAKFRQAQTVIKERRQNS